MKNRNFQQSLRTSTSQISITMIDQDFVRQPPQKIRQNKFTKTYSKLKCIPLQIHIPTLHPLNIEHLYLSHNNIKSLKGIQHYSNLVSLNVSYNCLEKIEQLKLIQRPQNLLRIGLKMNDFIYGYQDYAVKYFINLQKLDDLDIKDKNKMKQLQTKCQQVANNYLEFYVRIQRVLKFMDDLIKQEKLQLQMGLRKPNYKSINPKLKLLFQNMSQQYIAKISQIFIIPSQQQFLQLSSVSILNKIYKVITVTLEESIDLKCTCRPRIPFQDELKKQFRSICNNLLQTFSSKYNKNIQNGLIKIEKKLKLIYLQRRWQKWELWGMLPNYHTLTTGGKRYDNLAKQQDKYHLILNQKDQSIIQRKAKKQNYDWRNKVFSNELNSQNNKENFCPNIQQISKTGYLQKKVYESAEKYPEMFYDRIPMVLYEKNYIQALLQITMGKIKEMLQKYDFLNKAKTNILYQIDSQKKLQQKRSRFQEVYQQLLFDKVNSKNEIDRQVSLPAKEASLIKTQNNSSCKSTKRYLKKDQIQQNFQISKEQAMLKSTVVNNSPLNKQFTHLTSVTPRPFLTRNDSEISFGLNKQQLDTLIHISEKNKQIQNRKLNCKQKKSKKYPQTEVNFSIHQINLIYKVFRGLKSKVIKRKKQKFTISFK